MVGRPGTGRRQREAPERKVRDIGHHRMEDGTALPLLPLAGLTATAAATGLLLYRLLRR